MTLLATSVEQEIRHLLKEGRLSEAQVLLAKAGDAVPVDSSIRKALAPPTIRRVARTDKDRSAEFRWLKTHSEQHRREWVALLDEALIAHAETLQALLVQLEGLQLSSRPLIHHLD